MRLNFRRRVPLGRRSWLNLSGSGASVSQRFGRLTVNTRGRSRIRLGKGFSLRL